MRHAAGMIEDTVMADLHRVLQRPEIVSQVAAVLKQDRGRSSKTDAVETLQTFHNLWGQLSPAVQARSSSSWSVA